MATQEQLAKFKCEKPVSRWVSRGFDPFRDGYCVEVIEDCGTCAGCLSRLVIQMVEGIDGESIHE